jgi:hypothetical protein
MIKKEKKRTKEEKKQKTDKSYLRTNELNWI